MKNQYAVDDSVSKTLLEEIIVALQTVKSYGSVEIYVQKGVVTQITVRKIKKTTSEKY
jgi:hypothetical protein